MKDVPEVGEPICWTPAAFTHNSDNIAGVLGLTVRVSGRITYVNEAHRWYRAEASFPGGTIRECFNFNPTGPRRMASAAPKECGAWPKR